MVWRDHDIELTTCPVLAFSPEVKEIGRWFDLTHHLVVTPAGAIWQRMALPAAGGAGDQDARLMAALDALLEVRNRLLLRRRPTSEDELTAFHKQQRR